MAIPIKQIQVGSTNYNIRGYFYGTCNTGFDTAAKVVECPEFSSTDLVDSTIIVIYFNEGLTYEESGAMTLNVNGTGAKPLKWLKDGAYSDVIDWGELEHIPALCMYVSDVNYWLLIGPAPYDTGKVKSVDRLAGENIIRYASCSVGASTAAKTANVTSGTPTLAVGLAVYVKFTNANTADNPTLNINSKGAKNIFYNGVQITTGSEKSLLKGLCLFVYDGTQWHLIPSSENSGSDTKVSRTATTDNAYYRLLMAYTSGTVSGTVTEESRVADSLYFNPSTQVLTAGTNTTSDVKARNISLATHTHSVTTSTVATTTPSTANTGSTTITPAGVVTGSLNNMVLTLAFAGTSDSHTHNLNSHTHNYVKATGTGAPQ